MKNIEYARKAPKIILYTAGPKNLPEIIGTHTHIDRTYLIKEVLRRYRTSGAFQSKLDKVYEKIRSYDEVFGESGYRVSKCTTNNFTGRELRKQRGLVKPGQLGRVVGNRINKYPSANMIKAEYTEKYFKLIISRDDVTDTYTYKPRSRKTISETLK